MGPNGARGCIKSIRGLQAAPPARLRVLSPRAAGLHMSAMTVALRTPDPTGMPRLRPGAPVAWRTLPGLADYLTTAAAMESRVERIIAGEEAEAVWLLEHPPLYTAGTSAKPSDLLAPGRLPVFT